MQAGHSLLYLHVPVTEFYCRRSVAWILILGTLQTLPTQFFLLLKYNLIVTQMSVTWSSRDKADQMWADPRLSTS